MTAPMDPHTAMEQKWSFINDLRACVGMMEAVQHLDAASMTHPHGMDPEVIKQRNALLRVARQLCRAEMIQRWDALQERWPMFTRALEAPTQ